MDDDDDDDDKHAKREREETRRGKRRGGALSSVLTVFLILLVWRLEHQERDAFFVQEEGEGEGNKVRDGGWKRYSTPAHEEKSREECTVDRFWIDALSLERFNREYRDHKPVVVRFIENEEEEEEANEKKKKKKKKKKNNNNSYNDDDKDAASASATASAAAAEWKHFQKVLSSKENLQKSHGEKVIVLSSANTFSYDKKEVKLKHYIDSRGKYLKPIKSNQKADKIWYWFGDNDHEAFGDFFPAFKRASLIGKKYVPESASVAYSYGIGGPLSGVPYHIHGPGWSESIYGRKKWFLSPPIFEPVFNGNETAARAAMRFKANGNKAKFKKNIKMGKKNDNSVEVDKYGNEKKVLTCIVNENEGIYFPDKWWHSTLNLDESVFMSSFVNYAK